MAGNWKMNLNHLEAIATVQKLAFALRDKDYDAVDIVVLPPFTDLRSVQTLIMGDRYRIGYGAQDLSPHDSGAHTGDVSGGMLAKLACTYVVVGHSERRADHGEDDALVNAKVKAALRHGLTPILCVGEGLDGPPGRRARRAHARPARSGPRRAHPRAGRVARGRVRAGLGDRHRRGRDARRTPKRCAARSAGWSSDRVGSEHRGHAARALRRVGQGRQHRRRSWPSPTSTARWSAARASIRTSSSASAGSPTPRRDA